MDYLANVFDSVVDAFITIVGLVAGVLIVAGVLLECSGEWLEGFLGNRDAGGVD